MLDVRNGCLSFDCFMRGSIVDGRDLSEKLSLHLLVVCQHMHVHEGDTREGTTSEILTLRIEQHVDVEEQVLGTRRVVEFLSLAVRVWVAVEQLDVRSLLLPQQV